MNDITVTVPMEENALTRASDFFHGLAIDMRNQDDKVTKEIIDAGIEAAGLDKKKKKPAKTEAKKEPDPASTTTAEDAFGDDPKTTTAGEGSSEPSSAAPEAATSGEVKETPAAPPGVDLDSDGLPWDARIHALSAGGVHSKLKKTNQWKKKRGIDPALVETVEAELKAAMSASPAAPITEAPATTETPAAPAGPETPAGPAGPEAPTTVDAGTITTLPQLMGAITAGGIDQATVLAAVNTQGLQSVALLGARPDLIPAVALELFK